MHAFLREELQRRYQPQNIRRFSGLDALSDERINALREFLLENIYPPPEKRVQIEAAFDHLNALLNSPARLRPLLRTLAGAIWRLGRQLPAALSAGRGVTEAFMRLRDMEAHLVAIVDEAQHRQRKTVTRPVMVEAVASLSKKDVQFFVRELTHLLKQLARTDLLRAMVNAITCCKNTMDVHPHIYPEAERAGVALALEIVSGALELFQAIPSPEIMLIVHGVMLIEQDWHDRMCREAAEGSS